MLGGIRKQDGLLDAKGSSSLSHISLPITTRNEINSHLQVHEISSQNLSIAY